MNADSGGEEDLRAGTARGSLPLIAFLVLVPLAIGIGTALFRIYITESSCANGIVAEEPAPGAAHRAVVFRRNCGATTPYTTNVSVLSGDRPLPNQPGNVVVLKDLQEVSLRWADPTHLEVGYPRGAEPFPQAGEIDGVAATLEAR